MTEENEKVNAKKEHAKWRILDDIRLLETRIEIDKARIKIWKNILKELEVEEK